MALARRLSILLFGMTFALILLGGIVHTTGSSLACPDWPLCFGQVFPRMQGGVLYEHGHRLLAGGVASLATVLWVVLLWQPKGSAARALGRPAGLGVGLVLIQATLGGLTVILRLPTLVSTLHLATSMLFFAWATWMWARLREVTAKTGPFLLSARARGRLRWAAILVYVQIVLGAFVRHSGASMTCGRQALLCNDRWLPQGAPQWVQTTHRLLALVAVSAVVFGTLPLLRAARLAGQKGLRRLALSAHGLVTLQVLFGILTIKTNVHLHVVTTHLALGALLWAILIALLANTRAISSPDLATYGEAPGGVERPSNA